MERKFNWLQFVGRTLSYLAVAAAASLLTLLLWNGGYSKLDDIQSIINGKFIGAYDEEKMVDAAARAMVDSLNDRWSSYMSADEFAAYQDGVNNAYVGIGITIVQRTDGKGYDIMEVAPGSSAQEAGVLPGDIVIAAQGEPVIGENGDNIDLLSIGEAGTKVSMTVLRGQEEKTFTMERRSIQVIVASGEMLEGKIGLVRIANFNYGCGDETIAAIEQLREQGATALIFDVRNNPGGYVDEMTKVLDYLLPEGIIFRDVNFRGKEGTVSSDAACLELPMAVLVNGNSYSAAEFFAACLQEYEWAKIVGEKTCGKGYYQNTIPLMDGSAVHLSTGKYFTPGGVSLTEAGGVTLDVEIPVDEKTAALIYAQALKPAEDPQLQAAVQLVGKTQG